MTKKSKINTTLLSQDMYKEILENFINTGIFRRKNGPFRKLLEWKPNPDGSYTLVYVEDNLEDEEQGKLL